MIKKTEFDFDEDTLITYCRLEDARGRVGVGQAICHDEDADMISWRTGEEIAFRRAKIALLCQERDEIKQRLAALNQLYYSMKHSKQFNKKSYENRMLQRQIRITEFDLTTIKEMLAYERQFLKDYIQGKDKIYNKIRQRDKAGQD